MGGGGLLELEATGILTKNVEQGGTTLVDSRNGFSNLVRLEMLWIVNNRWPEGARFAFNCYRHLAHLLLLQMGDAPVILLRQEGVYQGDPLLMVLYGITLVPPFIGA